MMAMAAFNSALLAPPPAASSDSPSPSPSPCPSAPDRPPVRLRPRPSLSLRSSSCVIRPSPKLRCSAGEVSVSEASADAPSPASSDDGNWVPVIPLGTLPKGERRLIRQDGEDVLLLWYKNQIYAIENTSPAEGAYSEGFVNAKLTQDGCIVCPSTESTFDLKTGEVKEWFPNNPVLRLLTPPLRNLITYPVKVDSGFIYISTQSSTQEQSAELVFGGQVQAGKGASNVEVDEVRMIVDDGNMGFGFTPENELTNGRSAMVGFAVLLIFELITGKGFLKGIGFLDFLYRYLPDFPVLRY